MLSRVPARAGFLLASARERFGERGASIALALALEVLLVLMLLTLGSSVIGVDDPGAALTSVDFQASSEQDEPSPEPETPEPEQPETAEEEQPTPPQEQPPQPAEPLPEPVEPLHEPVLPPPIVTTPNTAPSVEIAKPAPPAPPKPAAPSEVYGPVLGPPARSAIPDSQRVSGSGPNGEPLYAAQWFRRPRDDELGGYLSTASGPGWGLIACRTAPDYRVEDCVALEEFPPNSNINRAILAAAWQFQVRPPRLGGKNMVGEWVKIRIDYYTR